MRTLLFTLSLFPISVAEADSRRTEETERYELYELRYVEFREADKSAVTDEEIRLGRRALVSLPDGEKYLVKVGHYLGKNNGMVNKIEPGMIYVIEVLPHCEKKGFWIERMNFLHHADKSLANKYTMKMEDCHMWKAVTVEGTKWKCNNKECQVSFNVINLSPYPVDATYNIHATKKWLSERGEQSMMVLGSCSDNIALESRQTRSMNERLTVDKNPNAISVSAGLGYGFFPVRDTCK